MKSILNFFIILSTLGAVQSILIAIALFTIKKGNRTSNRLLGLILISLAIIIFSFILYYSQLFLTVPYFYGIDNLVIFLLGPLLYFYAKSATCSEFKLSKKDSRHFILFGLILLLNLPDILSSTDSKIAEYQTELLRTTLTPQLYVLFTIFNLYLFAYLGASLKIFWKQARYYSLKNITVNIRWLRNLLIAFLVIQIFSSVFDFFNLAKANWTITPFFLTVVIYGMSYVGIQQSQIFTSIHRQTLSTKYKKSALTEEMAEKIIKKLEFLMKEEKIFLDSTLSLPQLAQKLAITTHLLSQVLNERLNQSFFNFINEHRIQEAQNRLCDPQKQNYNILEIAQEVGFNSISAFNVAFKKHTGLSPSEFRERQIE